MPRSVRNALIALAGVFLIIIGAVICATSSLLGGALVFLGLSALFLVVFLNRQPHVSDAGNVPNRLFTGRQPDEEDDIPFGGGLF